MTKATLLKYLRSKVIERYLDALDTSITYNVAYSTAHSNYFGYILDRTRVVI